METLKKELLKKKLSSVYFLHGNEDFLKEEITEMISKALFSSEEEAIANTHRMYAQDITLGELVSKASEYPMFTQKQLLVVRHFEKIKKPSSKEQQKQHNDTFTAYIKNPAEFTVLLLDAAQLEKSDLEKLPFSTLKNGRHDFPPIKTPDVFAANRAATIGWEFEPDALKAFIAYTAPSAREISQEIDKIILYASTQRQEKHITATDVYDCVGISRSYNVFELEKALAARNLRLCSGMSLMIMDQEGDKEGLANIVRYLTTFYTRLWKLTSPEVQQLPQAEIAKILGMYGKQEFFVKNYLTYSRAFNGQQCQQALCALRDTDAALKGIIAYPDEQYLLLQLMQKLLG